MDDEICSFIDKAETKLKNSKVLFEVGGYSDSVSLSYYCMFLCAKALLVKKNCKIPKSHRGLIQLFSLNMFMKMILIIMLIIIYLVLNRIENLQIMAQGIILMRELQKEELIMLKNS